MSFLLAAMKSMTRQYTGNTVFLAPLDLPRSQTSILQGGTAFRFKTGSPGPLCRIEVCCVLTYRGLVDALRSLSKRFAALAIEDVASILELAALGINAAKHCCASLLLRTAKEFLEPCCSYNI